MADRRIDQGLTRVHLDYHTSPHIEKIAERFDPDEFASTLAEAQADSVVVFAKCHHGYSYYDTKVGKRHPGLDFDLLREMISACHKRDILTPVYYSIAWDELVAAEHPDWRQVDAEGKPRDKLPSEEFGVLGWASLCFNSPYVEEVILPQTEEILKNYEADGLWYDIVVIRDEACYCRFCRQKMQKLGLDPASDQDQHSFARASIAEFVKRTSDFARSIRPRLSLDYNGRVGIGSREHLPFVTNVEIEALPSTAGYLYFPVMSRHARTYAMPMSGLTCRFIRMWGDFGTLKPEAQLQYEAAVMLSTGARVSIGDQLDPDGELRKPAYGVIGRVFSEVHKRRKWSEGTKPIANVALFAQRSTKAAGGAAMSDATRGAAMMLLESHHQFDVIDEKVRLEGYELVIVPGGEEFSPDFGKALADFAAKGGKLLATAEAAASVGQVLGVRRLAQSGNPREYIRPFGDMLKALPPIDHVVYGAPTYVAAAKADVVAGLIPPYFPRSAEKFCSHRQTPPVTDDKAKRPAVTLSRKGAYIAAPIFKSYARQPNPSLRALADWLISRFARPLVRTNLPGSVDASLLAKGSDAILHLVSGPAPREHRLTNLLEQAPAYVDVRVSVLLPKKPSRVYLAPAEEELDMRWEEGRAEVRLGGVSAHTIVVFEGIR